MKRYAGWFRALVVTIVCFLALSGAVLPAAAADTTMTLELWFEVDGSGSGQLHVFIPAGNTDNIDDLVSGMSSEAALSGVVMTDLGGGNYQINFTWSSFFDAFDPNSWADNGDTVEGEFGALVQSFTEVILHLPGTVLQQQGGTKVDNFTLSFKGGSTATFSFSKNGVVPSPTPSPSSSPTASQETYDIELWINTDGSGRATVTAYLPPGGHTADEMVSSLQSEPTFTGVTQKSLGGDNYEITFKWSDFETAFDPGMWVVSGNNVDLDLGYLTETFAETTVHLPGTIISSSTGIWIDDFSIVFISGDNTEISIDLSVPPPPTPTSPATPKPTPTATPTPKPTPTSSPTPKPTLTATPTPKPTTPVPTDTPPPPPTDQPSPSPSVPVPTTTPIPPTATPVPIPTPGGTPSSGLSVWAIVGIAGGAVLVVLILVLLLRGKRRPPASPTGTTYGVPPSGTPYGAPPTPPKPTTGARFCPSCGSPVQAGAPFCPTCGAAQGVTATTRPASPPPPSPPPPPPSAVVTAPVPPAPVVEPIPTTPPIVESTPPPVVEPVPTPSPVVAEATPQEVESPSPALCAGCGKPLAPGARFCMGCGKAVE